MPSGRTLLHALCALSVATGVLAAAPAAYAEDAPAGPELRAVEIAPRQVAVSEDRAVAGVTAHVVGAASGVTAVAVRLADGAPAALQLTAGTPKDGTWSGVVTVPAATPHGGLDAAVYATDAADTPMNVVVDDALLVADAPPALPAAVAAAAMPGDSPALLVTWAPPPANGGSPVEGYDVTVAPAPGADPSVAAPAPLTAAPDATSVTVGGLAPDTRYVVRVAARNGANTGPAAQADATTARGGTVPDGPTSVVAAPGSRTLGVAWTAPVSVGGAPLTGYELRATPRVADPVATVVHVAPDATAAPVTGLANGVTYDVAVTARNANGAGLAGVTTGTPRTVPGAPRLDLLVAGDGAVYVSWLPPASNGGAPVESYTVTAAPSRTVTLPATARSTKVLRLPNGVAQTFTVTAANAAGTGARVTSGALTPRKPGRLSVTAQPDGGIVHGTATAVGAAVVAGGVGVPGQRVDLMARVRPSSSWRRVATGTTGSTGRVTLRATLPATSALRLHHPASAIAAPDVAVNPVYVATRVSASAARIRIGQTVVARGGVAPAHGVGSSVVLQRYADGAWRSIATGRMTTSTAFRASWKPARVGTYTLRVVKPGHTDHTAGKSPSWRQVVDPETAADIARTIRDDGSIKLETTHDSGITDLAHARQNIVDVAAGRLARRSAYQNAPGGYTTLDKRLLRALRRMGERGSVTVSEIAGGSHSRGSTHYYGKGLDISWVNGRHVAPGSGYSMAVDACRAYGAVRVFHPSYDPYGGHSHHVHCDW